MSCRHTEGRTVRGKRLHNVLNISKLKAPAEISPSTFYFSSVKLEQLEIDLGVCLLLFTFFTLKPLRIFHYGAARSSLATTPYLVLRGTHSEAVQTGELRAGARWPR